MLAVLTTHPIQYQIPVWKGLAARKNIPFRVFYMSDLGLKAQFDPGFGKSLSWDIDLLGGYESEFLDTYKGHGSDSFWWLRLRHGFGMALRGIGADVLWIQGWQVVAYWQAVFEARKAGNEIWLRGETNGRSSTGGRIGGQLKRRLLRELLGRVDRFLYIGEANRQFYLEQGISEGQLASAPYCVDNARFATAAAAARRERDRIREEWRIPADAFCVLFAGKMIAKKRPLDIVQATRLLQNALGEKIHVLWVGTGELGNELRQSCHVCFDAAGEASDNPSNRHHGPNASFVGFLNQSEISRAYAAADCLVLPSDAQETWGLVVNEAMASGLPCVVSDACGCAEDLVNPIRADLCYPVGDVSALERAMAAAMNDPPSSQLLRAHISKYDISKTIDAVESLYLERVGSNSGRRISKM